MPGESSPNLHVVSGAAAPHSAPQQGVGTSQGSATALAPGARTPATDSAQASNPGGPDPKAGLDLVWVWSEVRQRVFIKLPFSRVVADALEAVVPITLDDTMLVCGLTSRNYVFSGQLQADQVRNTIESILRHAAGRHIQFTVIEGTTLQDWHSIKHRRQKAQAAIIAIAQQNAEIHHYEDYLNQIVSDIRHRVTSTKDRIYPQVRAGLLLEIAPELAAAENILFAPGEMHDARRALARAIDRVASLLEMTPLTLALEIERFHRSASCEPVTTAKLPK